MSSQIVPSQIGENQGVKWNHSQKIFSEVTKNLEFEMQETRNKLKRELRAEAMTRLEEAARTKADFENVVKCWDKLDEHRERKERYHEVGRSNVPLEYGSAYGGSIFPTWMGGPNSRAIRQGRFLDVFFNCPHELHQMVGHPALSQTFRELDTEYKELLFFLVVRNWSAQSYAQALTQTDRNVRKKMTRLVSRIQSKLYNRLNGESNLSQIEKEFLDEYEKAVLARSEKERCAV